MTDGDLPTLAEAVATLARAAASAARGEPPELTAGRIEEQVRSLRPDGRPRLGLGLGDRREFVRAPFEAGALVAMGRGIGEPLEGRRFVRFANTVACTWTL